VKLGDLDRAAELLVSKLGYRLDKKERYDVSLFTPSNAHIELHFGLVEDVFREAEPIKNVWDGGELREASPHRYEMTPELFLFFHIYHTA
jgi:hypothetical protein